MKRLITLLTCAVVSVLWCTAAIVEPIKISSSISVDKENGTGEIVVKAEVEKGWHLYGFNLPQDGPKSTQIVIEKVVGAELVGEPVASVVANEGFDEIFGMKLSWWDTPVSFVQKFKLASNSEGVDIKGQVSFQACNDQQCISPSKIEFDQVWGNPDVTAEAVSDSLKTVAIKAGVNMGDTASIDSVYTALWWQPADFKDADEVNHVANMSSYFSIFVWGFLGGLLALFTPCVWPMIPMTVSFFLKKNNAKNKGIRDAVIYGASIVAIYLFMGLAVTLIFGASKLNELSTNAVFNLLFFLLLVVFGVSFLGAFEISLPSRWSNAVDGKAESTTGLISIFFMAFTLSLVSFSCTGPIIGTLLVEAASNGEIAGPAIGMGAFALALAIPFALFALFPSWLKEMPKSGGWLNSVKVVLGFLELALSLKFLSVADLAYGWGVLDREVFICLWVVIFALLGVYLLGKIQFSHDSTIGHISVGRFMLALLSFSFSLYLVPGLWGAPLKGVSAFVPPLFTQDFNLYENNQFREFHDYDEGMAYASREGLPVLMDFSGYGCVNCRKMEGAVFDTQEVGAMVRDNYVLIKLMVDDKTTLPQKEKVKENGKIVTLETYGDKWSYLQRSKFNANSQPYYVQLDNDGQPVSSAYFYDENIIAFTNWLDEGLKVYGKLLKSDDGTQSPAKN